MPSHPDRVRRQYIESSLTRADVDQIIDGIEHFIMNGDPEVDRIWQPYVEKLTRLKVGLEETHDG